MMNDEEITALAKGVVPFVRDCVTEAITPFAARLTEIEARPHEVGPAGPQGPPGPPGPVGEQGPIHECVADAVAKLAIVPPELAEQVASAVRLLHEAPPIVERSEAPQQPALPRVTRVERDEHGNFVPVYGEP